MSDEDWIELMSWLLMAALVYVALFKALLSM